MEREDIGKDLLNELLGEQAEPEPTPERADPTTRVEGIDRNELHIAGELRHIRGEDAPDLRNRAKNNTVSLRRLGDRNTRDWKRLYTVLTLPPLRSSGNTSCTYEPGQLKPFRDGVLVVDAGRRAVKLFVQTDVAEYEGVLCPCPTESELTEWLHRKGSIWAATFAEQVRRGKADPTDLEYTIEQYLRETGGPPINVRSRQTPEPTEGRTR